MKLFESIYKDALGARLSMFFVLCCWLAISTSLFLLVFGIYFVLGIFKFAMEIDEFHCRHDRLIDYVDSASNVYIGDEAVKVKGKWL